MDNITLHALYLDFRQRLEGCRVGAVESPQPHSFLFRFDPPVRPGLLMSVHPDLGGLFPLPRMPRRRAPATGSHAALLHRVLAGARLAKVEKPFNERVVRFRFTGANWDRPGNEAMLMAEFLGRSANLILTRSDGIVAGSARSLGSTFRALPAGDPYVPPPARTGGEEAWSDPAGCLAALRAGGDDAAVSILRFQAPAMFGLWSSHGGTDARRFVERILSALEDRNFSRCLYLDGIPAAADASAPIDRRTAILSLLPMPLGVAVEQVGFSDLREAAGSLAERMFRHRQFRADLAAMRKAVVREEKKLARLRRKLQRDLEKVSDAEPLRIRAEALLAGLSGARVRAGRVRVVDPYDPGGGDLEFDLPDPAVSLARNAAVLFHRYRRAQRGRDQIGKRLAAIEPRAAKLADLAARAGDCRTEAGLEELEDRLGARGIVRPVPAGRGPRPARTGFRSLRKATSPDGWTVYIGRNAVENHELTFRIASEWDIWFHAAGVRGSHVLARNPGRSGSIPERTLRMAAAAAAWYSGARGGGPVEVHYAPRRLLRKGKSPGQVLIKRFRSIRIEPADPLVETE